MAEQQTKHGSGALPTFFQACCEEAKSGSGYAHPGYHLAIHLSEMGPDDLSPEEWAAEMENLTDLLSDNEDKSEEIWNWFKEFIPRCAGLVPEHSKDQFIEGVYQAFEAEKIG